MKSNYQESERIRSINLIKNSDIFESEKSGKVFMRSEREFVLQSGDKNLVKSIRNEVIDYFKNNNISWWNGNKPTGHVLSSQIACLNHLFAIRSDKNAVLKLTKTILPDFIDVIEIGTDKYCKGFIQFEAISDNDYLNETNIDEKLNRGNNCTSIDVLIFALHKNGTKWLIPIEWKYTEHYSNQNKAIEGIKKDPENCKGKVRQKRYTGLINNSLQLKNENHNCYYYEPFYQLMRQTLWVEQMIKNKNRETLKADDYIHIHVIPNENKDLLDKKYKCSGSDIVTTWKSHLKNSEKYMIISPEKLLSNCLNDNKYTELENYLIKRYWKK